MTRWKEISGANERINEMEPIGVIDIGSNSVRLVVYEGAVRALTPVFNEKILCGLGRSVATTGSLGSGASTGPEPDDGLDHARLDSLSARASEAPEPFTDDGEPDDDGL